MKHTPGPWEIKFELNIEATSGRGIATIGYSNNYEPHCHEENKANAQYIITACNSFEDLLEACKAIVNLDMPYLMAMEKVQKAIAKAEGETL